MDERDIGARHSRRSGETQLVDAHLDAGDAGRIERPAGDTDLRTDDGLGDRSVASLSSSALT